MTTFTIALWVLFALTVGIWLAAVIGMRTWSKTVDDVNYHEPPNWLFWAGGVGALLTLLLVVAGWMAISPQYRLYRASVEKRILVEEARAQADAALELADAEVARATGTAEANSIVADSITEPYLRYLYIDQLDKTSNQIIYIPTEAGLPILEAGRATLPEE